MISQAAIDAVTNAANLSSLGEPGAGVQAVRTEEVVAELRSIEGLSDREARRAGREAVAHIGGHVEPQVHRGGLAAGRRHHAEAWWVPRWAIRR